MKTVQVTSASSRTAGKRNTSKKTARGRGAKPVGVSEADLRRFGIAVGGKSNTTGKKKSRKRTSSGRSNETLTRDVRSALNTAGIVPNKGSKKGKTTGQLAYAASMPQPGIVGQAGEAVGNLASYGMGAVAANAAGGLVSQLTGQFFKDARVPWNKFLVSLIGAFVVSMPWFRRFMADDGRNQNAWLARMRRGMLGYFGFTVIYNGIRTVADAMKWNLDAPNPNKWGESILSYFGGTNGLISMLPADPAVAEAASKYAMLRDRVRGLSSEQLSGLKEQLSAQVQAQKTAGGWWPGGTGGVQDLFAQSDLVARLGAAMDELEAKRSELSTAIEGLYGSLTDEQLAVYAAASDYICGIDNRLEMARGETNLDRAAQIVLEGNQMAQVAQGLLAGLTAGVTAPAAVAAEAQAEAVQAQQAAQQHQAAAQQLQAQAVQTQAVAQQQAVAAQQMAAQGQAAAAQQMAAQSQVMQQQAGQLQQQAMAHQQAANDMQQQAFIAAQEAQAPLAVPQAAQTNGWYQPRSFAAPLA